MKALLPSDFASRVGKNSPDLEKKGKRLMIQRIFRYGLVRIFGVIAYFSILAFLIEIMKQDPVMSSVVAFVFTVVIAYLLSHTWVFQSSRNHSSAIPRFFVVTLVVFFLNTGIMYLTVDILGWWYVWGQLSAMVVVPPTNFLLNVYWSFR